ncbi:MAG: DMT family transporter [Isosphaeraceae bacterium]|nr:DMT family transporter [Isosphaeraceae bacterium]
MMDDVSKRRTDALGGGRSSILAASVLWSLSGVLTKSIDLDSGSIAFYRSLFAGLFLLFFIPAERRRFRAVMLPMAAIFGAMIGAYLASVKTTTAANAIFLQCSSTFWVVPLGYLLLRERPDSRSLLGVALSMVGVVAIVGFGHGGTRSEWIGIALGLASGVGYALVVIGMRSLRELDPIWLSAVNNLGGAIFLGIWLTFVGQGIARPSLAEVGVLTIFGVVQMAIPYALFARGLKHVDATEAGLISLLEPILNMIWVATFIGERPRPLTIVGGGFLLLGVVCRFLPRRSRA